MKYGIELATTVLLLAFMLPARVAEPPRPGAHQRTRPRLLESKVEFPDPPPQREALVIVRLTVDENGRVEDVSLAEGGFHTPEFVAAAVMGARHSRYKPATLDGKPVRSTSLQPFNFSLPKAREGISPEFRKELNRVAELTSAGDYAGAYHHAEWMLAEKATLVYEAAVLNAQLARSSAAVGDLHHALGYARAATERRSVPAQGSEVDDPIEPNDPKRYVLPKEIVIDQLRLRMGAAAANGLLLEVATAYRELAGIAALQDGDPFRKLGQDSVQILLSRQPLVGKLRIDESGHRDHTPLHRNFSIGNVRGKVDAIVVDCIVKTQRLVHDPEQQWTIPAAWQGCSLRIEGTPDTELQITEYPGENWPADRHPA
jgi:hypothetical protein